MKITLFHFSDSHWKHAFAASSLSPEGKGDRNRFRAIAKTLKNTDLSRHKSDYGMLIHSGDFADAREGDLGEQFKRISKHFLPVLERFAKSNKLATLVAVPGNHDVDKTKAADPHRFDHFKQAFANRTSSSWITPFSSRPFGRVSLKSHLGKSAAFIALNSAARIGFDRAPDGEPLECPGVDENKLSRALNFLNQNDVFRVVILHHNPTSPYGQDEYAVKQDVFCESGNFCKQMREFNVKLLLFGHQHLTNFAYLALPDSLTQTARPILDSGFAMASAPSFLTPEKDTLCGFNVIEITTESRSNIALIRVFQYKYRKDTSGNSFILDHEESGTCGLPMERLHDLVRFPRKASANDEINRRVAIIRKVIDKAYDPESEIHSLERQISPRQDHLNSIRAELAHTESNHTIRQTYALNVLSPETWWTNELVLQFQRLFLRNINEAKHGTTAGHHFLFGFSDPVFSAITRALTLGANLKPRSVLWRRRACLTYYERQFFSISESRHRPTNTSASLSRWGHAQSIAGPQSVTSAKIAHSSSLDVDDIRFYPSGRSIISLENSKSLPAQGIEVARILLWPQRFFKSVDAWRIIQFHEDFLVPLFWLDPARLISRRGKPRAEIGVFLLYASPANRAQKSDGAPSRRSYRQFYTAPSGTKPIDDEFLIAPRGAVPEARCFWGENAAPKSFRLSDDPADEMSCLFRRPDLLFAIDAWAMVRTGKWDTKQPHLEETDILCRKWLNV